MSEARRAAAIEAIDQQLKELGEILDQLTKDREVDAAWERRDRWKERTIRVLSEKVSQREAQRFSDLRKGSFIMGQPLRNFVDEVNMYKGFFSALAEEIAKHGDDILESHARVTPVQVPSPVHSRFVFVIHGHDELNMRRLKDLLRDEWGIDPIILSREPGKGRTLIEKFEQEAERANYAIALVTPDDLMVVRNGEYAQARPNVIFELGWFYERLGRDRVAILFKEGTKIHSDLDGINRIEFRDDVNEKVVELRKELRAAGLV